MTGGGNDAKKRGGANTTAGMSARLKNEQHSLQEEENLKHNDHVYELLSAYFSEMDRAPLSPAGPLKSNEDKERYETIIMYAFRKYQAAQYHLHRVLEFVKKDEEETKKAAERFVARLEHSDKNNAVYEMKCSGSCDQYVYELAAWLAAIRSSLDFIATAAFIHIEGKIFINGHKMPKDTTSTFIKLVENGASGPILDECRKHLDWLKHIGSYRNNAVHRKIMRLSGGHEIRVNGDKAAVARQPVIIPQNPPSFVPDTRAVLMMDEDMEGLASFESKVIVTNDSGKKEIVESSHELRVLPGYVLIEEFMQQNLESFEQFFAAILKALQALDFSYIEFG